MSEAEKKSKRDAERERERKSPMSNSEREYVESEKSLAALRRAPREIRRLVFRAQSLAMTPDIPALGRDRDDQMTGSAAAVVHQSKTSTGGEG